MPEAARPPRHRPKHPLSAAHAVGQLARVRCLFCRVTRYYSPDDLRQLLGDVGIDEVAGRMRCDTCGRKDYLDATLILPTAQERQTIRLRRLEGIRTIRRPIWRDG